MPLPDASMILGGGDLDINGDVASCAADLFPDLWIPISNVKVYALEVCPIERPRKQDLSVYAWWLHDLFFLDRAISITDIAKEWT